jgi:very-short-patch-repair endonuclease
MNDPPSEHRRLANRREQRRAPSRIERELWAALRDRRFQGLKFRRQHSIGRYIADFYCEALKMVVEADGRVHQELEQIAHDTTRDEWMKRAGFTVVRIPEDEIINAMPLALSRIERAMARNEQRRTSPSSDLR